MRPPGNQRERRISREIMKLELRQAREQPQPRPPRPPGERPEQRSRPR